MVGMVGWYTTLGAGLTINEVLYDTNNGNQGPEPQGEWIEIYNFDIADVDVSGYIISDDPNPRNPGGEGAYTIPSGTVVPAVGFLLLVYDSATFWNAVNQGAYPPPFPTTVILQYGSTASNLILANSGDDIHLFAPDLTVVDEMWYGNGGDMGSTNAAPDVPEGSGLGRSPNGYDTDIPANDFYEAGPTQLTPGSLNPTAVEEGPQRSSPSRLHVQYRPSSLYVVYQPSGIGKVVMEIVNATGRRVWIRTLRAMPTGNRLQIQAPLLPAGVYTVRAIEEHTSPQAVKVWVIGTRGAR